MSTRYYKADSSVGRDRLEAKDYGKQQRYDSGIDSGNFCDSLPMQVESEGVTSYSGHSFGRPAPPNLIVDIENGDSGINMGDDDDVEKDCISTVVVPRQPVQSMDVDIQRSRSSKVAPRSPPSLTKPPTKRPAPRLPKKTISAATFASSSSNSRHDIQTVSAPQRSPSPRSVFTQRYPALSTHTTTTQSTATTRPFTTNKENHGRGPYSSMPAIRSASPLTCNNYQSLDMDRVPPTGVSIDIYQLQEYMSFFLPDTKDGDT